MSKLRNEFKYYKIADKNTLIPASGETFKSFYSPALCGAAAPSIYDTATSGINGAGVVFYGNSDTYEGLYYAAVNADSSISISMISDDHTPLPGLCDHPPSTLQNPYLQAYTASSDPNGIINSSTTTYPCPSSDQGFITFFAADWNKAICGIFSYEIKTAAICVLASSGTGPLQNYNFGTPYSSKGITRFSAELMKAQNTIEAGIYTCAISGSSQQPTQILDLLTIHNSDIHKFTDLGNSQLGNLSLYFYGERTTESPEIFSYKLEPVEDKLQSYLTPGEVISGSSYMIAPDSASTFHTNLSSAKGLVVAEAVLQEITNSEISAPGLIASINDSAPSIIIFANGEIPGKGGTFTGNGFPFVTDGTRVAFYPTYSPDNGFGEKAALFVWNSKTGITTKVLDYNDRIADKPFTNLQFSNCSFSNGMLAVVVENSEDYSVYVFDLSAY